ncbi:Syntaxin-10 [Dissostichus eleginoides]|uniref:Syntaxin-10 n=1 Tax=Dissostichus eleginoides TaxID=100907 RepID=A0AAD9F4V5_DISEL|nr:Syntaxin-10 [Dissostichus eleginoides]
MSVEDPFFVVKGEVQKALSRARGLFDRWEELLQEGTQVSRDELDWSANELRNCLRAIDWDLEDLSETISIVESNPGKFRLGDDELQERRAFVERTRTSVQEMKDHLSSPSSVAQAEKKNREVGQDKEGGIKSARERRAAGVGVWQHQSPQRHVGTHRGRAGRAGCHVGGLWRRDGSDVVPDGLGPEEAGEGVSHDQQ